MKTKLVVLIPILMMMTSGCLWAPGLDGVRKEIQDQIPGSHFEREFAISLGPISLGLARTITKMVPDEDANMASGYLKEIKNVKVAVYDAYDIPRDFELKTPWRLERLLEEEDWEMAVKVREDGESVWVLYREDSDTVRELFVVVLNDDELVLVKAEGRLDRLMEKVMEDHVDLPSELGLRDI